MIEKNKRVLFFVEAMGGGVFTYIVDLANELVNNYDVYIAYAVREQTPVDFNKYFDQRIILIEVKSFRRSINVLEDIKAFFEIRRIVKKVEPDIIHLHSSKAGVLGRWAFNGKKIPLFYTPHGYSFLMVNQSPVKRLIYRLIENLSSKRKCMTISCSKGEHLETLKLTKYAKYVSNGININELNDLSTPLKEEKGGKHEFTVFTLGRICYQKNPNLFNRIALAMPDVHFLWIGDGELRKDLFAPNIEVTGWVEREEALRHSVCSNVFLLTSLWEGLPMSLLEAMYLQKICVVSNVIGNRDVIHTDENGFVCQTVNEFVDAIYKAKTQDVNHLAKKAYSDILNKYNTTVMAKEYSDIYQEVLKKF